ncbi:MAG TPA: tripartite tricarboxylate transporter substrate binding protein [Acidobacteriaceae bacterium]|nr:tripartite tricarboxylate transporter substrate binding protein [Acidobacteriaceae bacterium]
MRALLLACAALALNTMSVGATAWAADYPDKPIRLIVPFAPGGGTDTVARIIAKKLSEALVQPIIVDNRAGGGGTIGAQDIVRAKPDGYTLIFGAASYATNAALYNLPYDPVGDITPISLVGITGYLVVVNPALNIKTTAELIAYAKANPGKLNYGSSGTGGLSHLGSELFDMMAGTKMTHVPYKGTGPALLGLLAGQTQLMLGSMPTLIPYVKAGKLTAVAVTTTARSAAMPSVPTVAETLPGYEATLWYGVWGPRGVPAAIVSKLNKALVDIVQMPDVKVVLANEGLEPFAGPPEALGRALKSDIDKWTKVVKAANVKVVE